MSKKIFLFLFSFLLLSNYLLGSELSFYYSQKDELNEISYINIDSEDHLDAIDKFTNECLYGDPYLSRSFHQIANFDQKGIIFFPFENLSQSEKINHNIIYFDHLEYPINNFNRHYQIICYQENESYYKYNRIAYRFQDGSLIQNPNIGSLIYVVSVGKPSANDEIEMLPSIALSPLEYTQPQNLNKMLITADITYRSPYGCYLDKPENAKFKYFIKRKTFIYNSNYSLLQQLPSFRATVCSAYIVKHYHPYKINIIRSKIMKEN